MRGAAGGRALAVLVGNSKLLWPSFLAACLADDALLACDDPLDAYTERCMDRLAQPRRGPRLAALAQPPPSSGAKRLGLCRSAVRVLYAHDEAADTQGRGYVGMQLLAEVAGIAYKCALPHRAAACVGSGQGA